MELARELSGLDADAGRKLDEPDAGICERLMKPIEYGTRQSEPPGLDELGDLPARIALTARPVCSEESSNARADAESAESP